MFRSLRLLFGMCETGFFNVIFRNLLTRLILRPSIKYQVSSLIFRYLLSHCSDPISVSIKTLMRFGSEPSAIVPTRRLQEQLTRPRFVFLGANIGSGADTCLPALHVVRLEPGPVRVHVMDYCDGGVPGSFGTGIGLAHAGEYVQCDCG